MNSPKALLLAFVVAAISAAPSTTGPSAEALEPPSLKAATGFHRKLYASCVRLKLSMQYDGPLGRTGRALVMGNDGELNQWTVTDLVVDEPSAKQQARPVLCRLTLFCKPANGNSAKDAITARIDGRDYLVFRAVSKGVETPIKQRLDELSREISAWD